MDHPFPAAPPANDNRDLYDTPEGAYFQILKARRRHLGLDTGAMSAGRYRAWRVVLDGLHQAEQALLPHLRPRSSTAPAPGIPRPLRRGFGRALVFWITALGLFRARVDRRRT